MTNTICRQCTSSFIITDEDRRFLDMLSPVIAGVKQALPEPTLCPECRQLRRQAAVNQIHLHRNTCALTKKPVISNFRHDSGYTVYSQKEWWGDAWDPLAYGRTFDFTRPFFEQYKELCAVVPYPSLTTAYTFDENSEYTNYSGKNKNCYLIFDSDENRDCYNSYSINSCRDCTDCHRVRRSELTAHAIDCAECYDCTFIQDCTNCTGSYFLKNCTSCKNCIFCCSLRNKEYYIENKPVSIEEFERIRSSLQSREALTTAQVHFDEFVIQFPEKSMHGVQNEDCIGDYLLHCKNATSCFDSENLWDCRYAYQSPLPLKDSMDTEQCGEGERIYESSSCVYNAHSVYFSASCWPCRNLLYCTFCFGSEDCFGCTGLKHKKFCILNTQYTKEEYEALVPTIIDQMRTTGEWGHFFPASLALFPYNETIASDYEPLSSEEALVRGYRWVDADQDAGTASKNAPSIPDTIAETPDSFSEGVFLCHHCGKKYRVTMQELALLRQKNLPLPLQCFVCRYQGRMRRRNPRKLYTRKCATCAKDIQTTYAPDRPKKVLCEECYLREVY